MLITLLIAFAVLVATFVVVVTLRPSRYRVTRSATIGAPAGAIFEEVNDFHRWAAWSPFEKLDPQATKSFEGAERGEGAVYRWSGNSRAGAGSTTITESRPGELIRIKLDMVKPFNCSNDVEFAFVPSGEATNVTWSMTGTNNFVAKAVGLFINMDKMCGTPFEEGLASLKRIVEANQGARAAAPSKA